MATGYQEPDSDSECESDNLTYDWEDCETLKAVKAFPISDYGTNYDQSSIEYPLVPEPSISEIADSTVIIPQQGTISDVEENFVEDDMSSLTNISEIQVSSAPKKHEFGKERAEREGNTYDKLYNACLKGELSTLNDILEKHSTLMQDEDGQTPLYAACIGDHREIIQRLIDFGYDVNHQDKEGKSPLHITFENYAPDLAQILITEFKANIEIRDKQNWTPLHTAIDRGYSNYSCELSQRFLHQDADTEVNWIQLHAASFDRNKQDVQFLLDAGTDANHVSSAGHTPLHIAVTKSNIDLVSLLLDQNININSATIDGKTPLHIAVEQGDEDIIQKLLSHDANPRFKDAPGNTSLHLAVKVKQETRSQFVKKGSSYTSPYPTSYHTCSIQAVEAIIEHGADVNAVNNIGQTALWFACVDGQDSFVKILLDTGAEPNIVDKYGDSCLHAAIHGQCSTETIHKIVDHGAHVNAVNKDGATPLLLACSAAHEGVVRLLLKAKADPNIADDDGDASLHAAAAADCSKETLQEVIGCGADLNAVNKRGITALLLNCFYRQMDSVKILLKAGADPTIADKEGFSCIHAAIDGRCSTDILQTLIRHGAHIDAARKDGTNALLCACSTEQSESVRFLVQAKADVSITKPDGNTCLHVAVKGECCREALQKIFMQGMINVNAANKKGETALLFACLSAQAQTVNLLLQEGADPNISDARGYTSLHAAVYGSCGNETLQEIINHDMQLDCQDNHGKTALMLACSYKQQDSVRILMKAGFNPYIRDDDGGTCLHAAAMGGCSKKIIQTMIDHGADVNATYKTNETPLLIACIARNECAIRILLNASSNPNITDDTYGDTCLIKAIRQDCSIDVLQAIIDHAANVNATNKDHVTALIMACIKKHYSAINILLNASADPNIPDDTFGDTCLIGASKQQCSIEVLQLLIDHGADVNATNKENETALTVACSNKDEDAINVLLNASADLNITDDTFGDTCLHTAVREECSREVLQAIIDHGAEVNATNKENETALTVACSNKDEGAINVLLNASADLNITDDTFGDTCLHTAVREECSREVLQAIIEHGAEVNATNKENETALTLACINKDESAINVLLNANADPNIPDNTYGDTCLIDASKQECSIEVIQALIDHGADVNATNKEHETALTLACINKDESVINVLLNACANHNIPDNTCGDTSIIDASKNKCSIEVIQVLIDHGADVNATNKKNQTALIIACINTYEGAINLLLNAGADPNIADDTFGDTCLIKAVRQQCSVAALVALIDHGADVNATNKNNETALILACIKKYKGAINVLLNASADPNITHDMCGDACLQLAVKQNCSIEVLQAIIHHGADVNAANRDNLTALTLACMKGDEGAMNVLLTAGANPNVTDYTGGDTCLHTAVKRRCSIQVLQAIIDHGADVNATNKINSTALTLSCITKDEGAINVLLNASADPNTPDDTYSETSLIKASKHKCSIEVHQAIIDHGADVNATNKNNHTALTLACINKDEGAINVLLKASADLKIRDGTLGDACLHTAVREECSTGVLQAIIDHGADVNATNKTNQTALSLACINRDEGAINVLLNTGADINISDDTFGDTCLLTAIRQKCSIEVIQAILDHGADVNATNTKNQTALTFSCINRDEGAINVLLNTGADINITDDTFGDTCLPIAIRQKCSIEVIQAIVDRGADINATNTKNQPALTLACIIRDEGAINILLNAGADINITDDTFGNTCFVTAIRQKCSIEVIHAILDHGADVNARNKKSQTALTLACISKDEGAVNVLLNAGAEPNIKDDPYGNTCLHDAVRNECSKGVLHAIIDHGADVNARNKKGQTALTLACITKHESAIKVLLNASADLTITDDTFGDTCLLTAVWNECSAEVLQAIIEHGADVNATDNSNKTALTLACILKLEGAINVLLDASADLTITDGTFGDTCLHTAVREECSIEVVQTIIDYGADVNATNKKGQTALTLACIKKHESAIDVLLNACADLTITDDTFGNTCLLTGVWNECSVEVVQAIIDHGADVNVTNKNNETALMLACQNRNQGIIKTLLNAAANIKTVDSFGLSCLHYIFFNSNCYLQECIDHCTHIGNTNIEKQVALVLQKSPLFAVSILLKCQLDPVIPIHNQICEELLLTATDHGADLHVVEDECAAAQLLACNENLKGSMNLLLGAGADTSSVDIFGDTCLHKIFHREYLLLEYDHETLLKLLDYGVPVNTTNKNHQTAYMLACDLGNIDAMCALLNAGADPNINSIDGGDANLHHIVTGCSSSVTLQTVMQWLDPVGHFLTFPALQITESLSLNLVSHITCNTMKYVICNRS